MKIKTRRKSKHRSYRRARKNPEFTIDFVGRRRGAIGVHHRITATVKAKNAKAAVLKLYDDYDHIQAPSLVVGGKKYRIPRSNPRQKYRRQKYRRSRR